MSSLDFLKTTSFFSTSPLEFLKKLEGCLEEKLYSKSSVVFSQGGVSKKFCLVKSGYVKILHETDLGKSFLFDVICPGEFVGAVALIYSKPLPASAICATDVVMLEMSGKVFLDIFSENPQLNKQFSSLLGKRLFDSREFAGMISCPIEERVIALVKRLVKKIGTEENGVLKIQRIFTRHDIANMLGATVETVVRVFSKWKTNGILNEDKDYQYYYF